MTTTYSRMFGHFSNLADGWSRPGFRPILPFFLTLCPLGVFLVIVPIQIIGQTINLWWVKCSGRGESQGKARYSRIWDYIRIKLYLNHKRNVSPVPWSNCHASLRNWMQSIIIISINLSSGLSHRCGSYWPEDWYPQQYYDYGQNKTSRDEDNSLDSCHDERVPARI